MITDPKGNLTDVNQTFTDMTGYSRDEVIGQIRTATSVEQLREIYNTYPEYRSKIEPLAIARKQEINAQIINHTKIGDNGTEKR